MRAEKSGPDTPTDGSTDPDSKMAASQSATKVSLTRRRRLGKAIAFIADAAVDVAIFKAID